jgi:hypothetical protein
MTFRRNTIVALFFILSFSSLAQEINYLHTKDTSLYLVQLYAPEFVFEQSLNYSSISVNTLNNFPSYPFQSSAFQSQSLVWDLQNNPIDIASPWKLQLAKENETKTWNMIFGSVGTGGALYIAYRHVKKYGFW